MANERQYGKNEEVSREYNAGNLTDEEFQRSVRPLFGDEGFARSLEQSLDELRTGNFEILDDDKD
jgi:hypothetical protein